MISSDPFESFGTICFQPIQGAGNSNERFFTRSGYKPPSAAKLMSSKKSPKRGEVMFAPGLSTCTVMVLVCATTTCATRHITHTNATNLFKEIRRVPCFLISCYSMMLRRIPVDALTKRSGAVKPNNGQSHRRLVEEGLFIFHECSYCNQMSRMVKRKLPFRSTRGQSPDLGPTQRAIVEPHIVNRAGPEIDGLSGSHGPTDDRMPGRPPGMIDTCFSFQDPVDVEPQPATQSVTHADEAIPFALDRDGL